MEYCPAGDLSDRLNKALPTETAVSYMRQIADGIGAAHKAGIIHRDIKPGNILFRSDGSIAIADFGIAKLQSAENNITTDGLSLGTILYISPEQICSDTIGRYSDLYSLGIIFYKMLTGEYPFFSNSVERILKAHLESRVPRLPSEFARFQPVIDRLLAKNPDERFQSTDEFIVDLEWN
jgi:serine/threonine protein kinase